MGDLGQDKGAGADAPAGAARAAFATRDGWIDPCQIATASSVHDSGMDASCRNIDSGTAGRQIRIEMIQTIGRMINQCQTRVRRLACVLFGTRLSGFCWGRTCRKRVCRAGT